jgi:hypothetical protein
MCDADVVWRCAQPARLHDTARRWLALQQARSMRTGRGRGVPAAALRAHAHGGDASWEKREERKLFVVGKWASAQNAD